jgi:uncharacterized surface protein with fasciclin (FAS1) repeats
MRTHILTFKKLFALAAAIITLAALAPSCTTALDNGIYKISDDKMLDELAEQNNLNDFLLIVGKAGLSGTIHSYGAYTLFAPTNAAIDDYLLSVGKSSPADLSEEEALAMVKYHLIPQALSQANFIDGRLANQNFAHRYLTTQAKSDNDRVYYLVNRQAAIIQADIEGANGYLHIIDHVLTEPENHVATVVRDLPDADFSLFKTLFERSGWGDSLSLVQDSVWFTLFVQDNAAFAKSDIRNEEELLAQLRVNTPAVTDDELLIRNFMGYHVVKRLAYVADLMAASSLLTAIPEQVIIFKRVQDQVLLNDIQMGKTHEQGVPLLRGDYTDLSCSNGVIHQIDGNIVIKNREAYRIYWDVAEQPELMAMAQFRNIQNFSFNTSFKPGELSEVTWGGKAPGWVYYYFGGYSNTLDEKFQYVYGDYLRFRMCSATISWMEFKTPVLVKGKYKVWLCYRREQELKLKTIFRQDGKDDQVLPYVFDLSAYMPNPNDSSHEQIEIDGWKQYNAKKFNNVVISHLLGIIDVESTGQHTLRFESTHAGRYEGNWDIIQFIPIDEDQLWPRLDIKGDWIYSDVPDCQIWPYSECETATEEETE